MFECLIEAKNQYLAIKGAVKGTRILIKRREPNFQPYELEASVGEIEIWKPRGGGPTDIGTDISLREETDMKELES